MDRAIVAELFGELVPLAAEAKAEDDATDRPPPVDAEPAVARFRGQRSILAQDRLEMAQRSSGGPQIVSSDSEACVIRPKVSPHNEEVCTS